MNNKKIWFKYGSNKDNKILNKFSIRSIDYFLYIPGKNVEHNWKLISGLITNENFIIDPSLYIFLAPKKYIESMSTNSFSLFDKIFNIREKWLDVNFDFSKKIEYLENNISEIVGNSINYQTERFIDNSEETENDDDIITFLKLKDKKDLVNIISPYFYINSTGDFENLLSINLKYLNEFSEQTQIIKNKKIFFSICLDLNVLKNDELIDKVISAYSSFDKHSFIIWFNEFDPWDKIINKQGFLNMKNLFQKIGKDNLILHAGFPFNFFRNISNIDKIITNVGYGESRSVFASGGRPLPYFYFKNIHRRIRLTDFIHFLLEQNVAKNNEIDKKMFEEIICSCVNCKDLIKIINSLKNGLEDFQFIMLTTKDKLEKNEIKIRDIISDLIWNHFVYWKIEELNNFDYTKESLEKWKIEIENYSKIMNVDNKKILNFIDLLKVYEYEENK